MFFLCDWKRWEKIISLYQRIHELYSWIRRIQISRKRKYQTYAINPKTHPRLQTSRRNLPKPSFRLSSLYRHEPTTHSTLNRPSPRFLKTHPPWYIFLLILGLASYGTVGRAFVQQVFGNDPSRLKSIHTRFVGHVFPG